MDAHELYAKPRMVSSFPLTIVGDDDLLLHTVPHSFMSQPLREGSTASSSGKVDELTEYGTPDSSFVNENAPGSNNLFVGDDECTDDSSETSFRGQQRIIKRTGTVQASARPINKKELDQFDALIKELKDNGESNESVRDKLVAINGPRYVAKSIATRYHHIKKVLSAYEDELLDDNLSDWHEGEDDMLRAAENEAAKAMEREMQSLEHKKWLLVKTTLYEKMKASKPKYSAQACQERFQALIDGTALPPIELDPNPGQRRADAQRRRQLRINAREAADAEAEAEEAARQEKRRAVKAERLERQRKRAVRRAGELDQAVYEATKSQTRADVRAERIAKQSADQAKQAENNEIRAERIATAKLKLEQKRAADKRSRLQKQAIARERAQQLKLDRKLMRIKLDKEFIIAELARPAERAKFTNILFARMRSAGRPNSFHNKITAGADHVGDVASARITSTVPSPQGILSDPRMRLTSRQLQNVLARYDPRVGRRGTKVQLVSRIQGAVAGMTKQQFHTHLLKNNIDTSGSLSTLLHRNADYDCLYSAANTVREGVFNGLPLSSASGAVAGTIAPGVSSKTTGGFVPFSMEC